MMAFVSFSIALFFPVLQVFAGSGPSCPTCSGKLAIACDQDICVCGSSAFDLTECSSESCCAASCCPTGTVLGCGRSDSKCLCVSSTGPDTQCDYSSCCGALGRQAGAGTEDTRSDLEAIAAIVRQTWTTNEGDVRHLVREMSNDSAAKVVSHQDQNYIAHLENCGSFKYDVSIYIDPAPHLFATGVPQQDGIKAGCPFGATHAITKTNGMLAKEILTFKDKEYFDAKFDSAGTYFVGSFTLAELENAFDRTEVGDPNEGNGGLYNVVHNNCGAYLVKLASHLGVKADHHMISFVSRRLMKHTSSELMKTIRQSAEFMFSRRSLRGGEDTISDEEIMELVVQDAVTGIL